MSQIEIKDDFIDVLIAISQSIHNYFFHITKSIHICVVLVLMNLFDQVARYICNSIIFCTAIALLFFSQPSPAFAAKQPPATCRVGIYLLSLRDLQPAEKSFGADFWVWSVCPSKDLKPLQQMEIVDAKSVVASHDSFQEKKDKFGLFEKQKTVFWSQRKINTIVKHRWDIRNFPFDRHTLEIPLEETVYDASKFVYTPDTANSAYRKDIKLEGWKITNFEVKEREVRYESTFGDPELKSGGSRFSRFVASIAIQRDTVTSFLRLTAGVYASFITVLLAFFLEPGQEIGGRTSLLVGALFATLVSMQGMDSMIGSTDGLTLVDIIHITAIVYIFAAAIVAVYSRLLYEHNQEKLAMRLDRNICLPLFGISFAIANAILISHAIAAG